MSVVRAAWRHAAALVLWCAATEAGAHTTSTGLIQLEARGDTLSLRLTLQPGELGAAAADLPTAAAGDAASASRVATLMGAHLQLAVDEQPCRVRRTRLQASQLGDERLVVWLDYACAAAPGRLALTDTLSTPFGEHYRSIASFARSDGTREERVLDREHTQAVFDAGRPAPGGWSGFVTLGMAHILSGADHLLFLAALLIGAASLSRLLLIVTAFTLAHSAALALAVTGVVHLSPAVVEPMIAASIVWVAAENIWLADAPAWRRLALAFAFGLVHGLAFSEALSALSLGGWALARALLGFNLGVEVGQALVVVALVPLLRALARRPAGRHLERWGSAAVGAAGLFWLVQRLV